MHRRLNSHVGSVFGIFNEHAKDPPQAPRSLRPRQHHLVIPPQHINAHQVSRPSVLTSPLDVAVPTCSRPCSRHPENFRSRPVEQNLSRVFSALLQSNLVTAFTYTPLLFLDSAPTCPQHVQLGQVNVSATLAPTRACATVAYTV